MPKTVPLTRDEIEGSNSVLDADSAFATDDIEDPALPMQTIADIQSQRVVEPTVDPGTPAGQVVMTVDEALYTFSQQAAGVLHAIDKSWDAALRVFNGNQQVLQALTQALQSYVPLVPFSASVSVVSPSGFPMTLSVQNATLEGFLDQMTTMMGFLRENQFTAPVDGGVGF